MLIAQTKPPCYDCEILNDITKGRKLDKNSKGFIEDEE